MEQIGDETYEGETATSCFATDANNKELEGSDRSIIKEKENKEQKA